MKKILLLVVLVQALPLLYADSGCKAYPYRWGRKPIESVECYCNCERYLQARGKCVQCGHVRIPKNITTSAAA